MNFLIISLFLAVPHLYAQTVIETLNNLNTNPPAPKVPHCSTCVSELELQKRCAVALCGKPQTNETVSLDDQSAIKLYSSPDEVARLNPLEGKIKEHLSEWTKANQILIDRLKTKLKDGKPNWDYANWDDNDFDVVAEKIYGLYFNTLLDHSKPAAQRIKFHVIAPKDASPSFKIGMDSFLANKKKNDLTYLSGAMLDDLYSFEEAKSLAQKEWIKLNARLKSDKKITDEQKEKLKTLAEMWKANEFTDAYDVGIFLTDFEEIYEDYDKSKFLCPEGPCRNTLKDRLSLMDLSGFIKTLEDRNSNPAYVQDEILKCQSIVAMAAVKDLDNKAMLSSVPQVKQRIMKGFLATSSEQSRKVAAAYLDKLEFKFKQSSGNVNKILEKIVTPPAGPDRSEDSEVDDLKAILKMGLIRPKPFYDFALCGESWGSTSNEYFHAKNPTWKTDHAFIGLSLYDCAHPKTGSSILMHEMGHALSELNYQGKFSAHSRKVYEELRSCSDSLYKTPNFVFTVPAYEELIPNKHLKSEEDMADLVQLMSDRDFSKKSCRTLYPDGDSYSFRDTLVDYKTSDTHSNDLVRLLRETVYRDIVVPDSCKELMDLNSSQINWNKCK